MDFLEPFDSVFEGVAFLEDLPLDSVFDKSFLELLPSSSAFPRDLPFEVDAFLLKALVSFEGLLLPDLFLVEGVLP